MRRKSNLSKHDGRKWQAGGRKEGEEGRGVAAWATVGEDKELQV